MKFMPRISGYQFLEMELSKIIFFAISFNEKEKKEKLSKGNFVLSI